MKIYRWGNKRMWYDRKLKLWTIQTVDGEDNQVGDVQYENRRELAFRWLREGGPQ